METDISEFKNKDSYKDPPKKFQKAFDKLEKIAQN